MVFLLTLNRIWIAISATEAKQVSIHWTEADTSTFTLVSFDISIPFNIVYKITYRLDSKKVKKS